MHQGDRPISNLEWSRLTVSRRARLTGVAGGLAGMDLAVFIVMAEHARLDGRGMRASVPTIARESGFSGGAVRRVRQRLREGYWVRCTHKSKGGLTAAYDKPNLTSCYDVLTLPADPGPKLAKSKRRAALFPEWRPGAIPEIGK